MIKEHLIFDSEIIGSKKPVFLVRTLNHETRQRCEFWYHRKGDMTKLAKMLVDPKYTWVGFNSENFDRPLIALAMDPEYDVHGIKQLATIIIEDRMRSWQTYKEYNIEFIDYDHIDLFEVAPGVMISLKTYAGRLGYKTMVDLPYHHDQDLTAPQQRVLSTYCDNDLGVTEALFVSQKTELALRAEMSLEYGVDLRSKSDAQVAEAVLRKRVGIGAGDKLVPHSVFYSTPDFIKTDSTEINGMIDQLDNHAFKMLHTTGSPIPPAFLEQPLAVGKGTYQCGIGGLHSTHDVNLYLEASDKMLISDFDVASYYPSIMLKAGLAPRLGGNKGAKFLDEYRHIYESRLAAKRAGNKQVANTLKIVLNGTFGKLGSIYCSFYSPDLMLAVTLSGQLNLLCIIHELEKIKGVLVRSANTDGLLVTYPPAVKAKVLKVFAQSNKRTGFEYEETPYVKYAAKDVNNFLALKADGSVKSKGLYASNDPKLNPLYLMKNPTMEVCTLMAVDYLRDGTPPEVSIKKYKDMADFVAIRNVKGGGIQFDGYKLVDDWVEVAKGEWRRPSWPGMKASTRRVSRPHPVEVGVGGVPLGRVVRWYMTTDKIPPLTYISSGNLVPKTEGARACMTLPDKLPKDLNYAWYINEAYEILRDIGVQI